MNAVSKYCRYCERRVLHTIVKRDGVFHALLTIFSCGLWLIPYIWLVILFPHYQCSKCGNKT